MAKKKRAMPKWRPAPPALIEQFSAAVGALPDVDTRKMFGYPAAFVHGNMFAGLFQDSVILRLSPDDRGALRGATQFEPMPGRPMREYVVAPAAVVDSAAQLRAWLGRARSFAAMLPPKAKAKQAATAQASGRAKPRRA
jgi:TfoX/Sxy family transcriptional regulator of competence genes